MLVAGKRTQASATTSTQTLLLSTVMVASPGLVYSAVMVAVAHHLPSLKLVVPFLVLVTPLITLGTFIV